MLIYDNFMLIYVIIIKKKLFSDSRTTQNYSSEPHKKHANRQWLPITSNDCYWPVIAYLASGWPCLAACSCRCNCSLWSRSRSRCATRPLWSGWASGAARCHWPASSDRLACSDSILNRISAFELNSDTSFLWRRVTREQWVIYFFGCAYFC